MSNVTNMPPFPKGELSFIKLLKSHTPFVPHWDNSRQATDDELDIRPGLTLSTNFDDPEELLTTAYNDFNRFLDEANLKGEIPLNVKQTNDLAFEEYRVNVTSSAIYLEASDTEGVRRGIYYLKDLISGAPFLKLGKNLRKPWLKNRISRCFFGPIKRPPFNVDELMNDIDYYPDEYLSSLAQEGINGLWLTITFREICNTSILPQIPEAAKRICKLRRTVEQCRRYGIKIWVFAIEPIYWSKTNNNPVPPGCEELLGPNYPGSESDMRSFCVNSPKAKQYLYECTYSLFSSVPHLGGMLTISHGERMTSCLSCIRSNSTGEIPCNKRCKKSIGEILADVLGSMKQGMHDANPQAELISWLYMPYVHQVDNWITKLPTHLQNDVALAFNFESGVSQQQLGAVRVGGDYWLSETGPSDRFTLMAQAVRGHAEFAAKLQVACSHECATVPYIPAPGLIYRKYRKMKDMGIKHVIQCWYFGNYPGVMNEAAGKLAYEDFSRGEHEFLLDLARPAWGFESEKVVKAWELFAQGYSNYPLDIQFQYYGPMHDGPVWPLHLKLAMKPLTRSWKPEQFPSGDAMGECMKHFELHELVELSRNMTALWHQGWEILRTVSNQNQTLELTLAEALDIQFRSGHNILKFYAWRNTLMNSIKPSLQILEAMKKLVNEEIVLSRRLSELCKKDSRLGYHSEAEVYKYFPEKLEWRAKQLETLLSTDFAEVESSIKCGNDLAAVMGKPGSPAIANQTYGENNIRWSFDNDCEDINFTITLLGKFDYPETVALSFMDRFGAKRPMILTFPKDSAMTTPEGWQLKTSISRALLGFEAEFFFGVERMVYTPDEIIYTDDLPGEFDHDSRLYLHFFSAERLRKVSLLN